MRIPRRMLDDTDLPLRAVAEDNWLAPAKMEAAMPLLALLLALLLRALALALARDSSAMEEDPPAVLALAAEVPTVDRELRVELEEVRPADRER